VPKPYSYSLPAGPVPFVDLGLYPGAFATRGFAANIGLVAEEAWHPLADAAWAAFCDE